MEMMLKATVESEAATDAITSSRFRHINLDTSVRDRSPEDDLGVNRK